MLGTVDSYGHLIVSKLDTTGTGEILYLSFDLWFYSCSGDLLVLWNVCS